MVVKILTIFMQSSHIRMYIRDFFSSLLSAVRIVWLLNTAMAYEETTRRILMRIPSSYFFCVSISRQKPHIPESYISQFLSN